MANPIRKILKHSIEKSAERLPRGSFDGNRRTIFGSRLSVVGRAISSVVDLEYVSNSMILGDTRASTSIILHRELGQTHHVGFRSQGSRELAPDRQFGRGEFEGDPDELPIRNLARAAFNLNRASALANRPGIV